MLNLRAIADSVLSEDAAPKQGGSAMSATGALASHDLRFHPNGYKKGDKCKYRENMTKGDKADAALSPDGQTEFDPSAEYAVVKAKYKGTPQWMKAPNGKPTNLTEKQWVQVRTPSFKRWFGDWEKAPENASKVIDSNGEPMVCWHGGPDNSFTRFDKRRIRPKDGVRAFFFAPPKRRDSVAGQHGEGKERPFFLNIRTPLVLSPDDSPKGKKGDGIIRVYQDDEEWEIPYFNYRTDKEQTETMRKGDIIEIEAFEPNQIKLAVGNSGEFNPEKETVMDEKIDLKRIASLAVAEDAAEETALEVALEYLNNEPTPPPRCRYPKVPMPSERRGESAATPAEDASPDGQTVFAQPLTDLQKHDRRFHPKGYKKGDACKYRETLAKTDNADDLTAAEREEHKEKYGNLSVKKRDEYFRLMSKKHPELDAEATLAEIGKITDPKVQKDAFAWVMRGAIKLPEDLYKVEQARELAGKAKVDPMSFDTPQACINDLLGKGHKVSLKPITVEELKKDPRFSDYKKLPYGVETFEVEDSKEGQMRMREVLDSHWGKDANPWCLLARGSGDDLTDEAINRHAFEWYDYELSDEEKSKFDENADDFVEKVEAAYKKEKADEVALHRAWDYWNLYNTLPKRVAFKDGKLLAFMATDFPDFDSWDEGDDRLSEMYPRQFEMYNKWSETDEGQEENASFREWLDHEYPELLDEDTMREHMPEQWWDRQDSPHKGIPLGNFPVENDPYGRWADVEIVDGKPQVDMDGDAPWHKGKKGTNGYVSWYDNGQKKEAFKDGKQQAWYENGDLKQKTYDDMTAHFQKDGKMSMLKNYGSNTIRTPMVVSFGDNGKPSSIGIHFDADSGERGYANLVLRRDGTLSPDSTLSPSMSEKEIRAKADALIAEAKRRFPNGGKQPAPSTDGRVALDQFPAFNPASFAAYLAKN